MIIMNVCGSRSYFIWSSQIKFKYPSDEISDFYSLNIFPVICVYYIFLFNFSDFI